MNHRTSKTLYQAVIATALLAAGTFATLLCPRQAWGPPGVETASASPTVSLTAFTLTASTSNPTTTFTTTTGLTPICPGLATQDNGCIRSTCQTRAEQCLLRPTTCATYVYKFSTPASVLAGHRTCTLYSQFNLPAEVILDFNLNSTWDFNVNAAEIIHPRNNPQLGAVVPQAFMDVNLNTTVDNQAVSGPVWQLDTGALQC